MRLLCGTKPPWTVILRLLMLPVTLVAAGTVTGAPTMPDERTREAIVLMNGFAGRSGLTGGRSPRRYLWTDAFAVCNYLGLARTTGDPAWTGRALQLVEQVHGTLGRHRDDDRRRGWISGLTDAEGERHPTRGGLRIGKPMPERGPDEPLDERLEWDRDGQYFHYLTKWMHALDQVTRSTGQRYYNTWGRELAQAAFDAFSYRPGNQVGPRRMAWKMSIDLTRVLVPSMGQHDPLEGYITARQLRSTVTAQAEPGGPDLEEATAAYAAMIRHGEWATPDPLGLGGLLVDAWRVRQLMTQGTEFEGPLPERLLEDAATGLNHYARSEELRQPARYRLAFRELGLAIGLHALARLQRQIEQGTPASSRLRALLRALAHYLPMRDLIEAFWRDPGNRRSESWTEHQDINEVMLATSLAPDWFLVLLPPE